MKIPKTLFRLNRLRHIKNSAGHSGPAPTKRLGIFLLFSSLLLFIFTHQIYAQSIQVEYFTGDKKVNFNSLISTLSGDGSIQFMNITIFDRYHNFKNKQFNGSINHSYLYWNFTRRLGVGPAVTYHPIRGMIPKIGFQYIYLSDRFFFRMGPAVDYYEKMNLELLVNASHSLQVHQNWLLITEFRSMNNYAEFRYHARSINHLRIGLRGGGFSFGFATEINQYSSHRITRWNTGLSVRYIIF